MATSEMMTLQQMREIIAEAEAGKEIERRLLPYMRRGGGPEIQNWQTMHVQRGDMWDFGRYEFRVKPTAPREWVLRRGGLMWEVVRAPDCREPKNEQVCVREVL